MKKTNLPPADPPPTHGDGPALRRADAARNHEHLLNSAAATFLREGPRFTMQRVAQDAGVGAGTLYRHFPDRDALLTALLSRSYLHITRLAREARAAAPDPLQAVQGFLYGIIEHRDTLVLPFTGAPPEALGSAVGSDVSARQAIREELRTMLEDGQRSGLIRPDVTALDVMVAGAHLARQLPHLPGGRAADRRQAQLFVDGLRGPGVQPLQDAAPSLDELERSWQQIG